MVLPDAFCFEIPAGVEFTGPSSDRMRLAANFSGDCPLRWPRLVQFVAVLPETMPEAKCAVRNPLVEAKSAICP